MDHDRANWLRHPYRLGGPLRLSAEDKITCGTQVGGFAGSPLPSEGPQRPKAGNKIRSGPQVGGLGIGSWESQAKARGVNDCYKIGDGGLHTLGGGGGGGWFKPSLVLFAGEVLCEKNRERHSMSTASQEMFARFRPKLPTTHGFVVRWAAAHGCPSPPHNVRGMTVAVLGTRRPCVPQGGGHAVFRGGR